MVPLYTKGTYVIYIIIIKLVIFDLGFLITTKRDLKIYLFIEKISSFVECRQRLLRGYLRSPHEFMKSTREIERGKGERKEKEMVHFICSKRRGKMVGAIGDRRSTCMHMLCMAHVPFCITL